MIITDIKQGWESKVNFTDSNDVFVGFDTGQSCCEYADWNLTVDEDWKFNYDFEEREHVDYEGYTFDTNYFKECETYGDLDEGGQVVFKLAKADCPDLYLHLFNSHNGYYGHGFEASISGELWKEDCV